MPLEFVLPQSYVTRVTDHFAKLGLAVFIDKPIPEQTSQAVGIPSSNALVRIYRDRYEVRAAEHFAISSSGILVYDDSKYFQPFTTPTEETLFRSLAQLYYRRIADRFTYQLKQDYRAGGNDVNVVHWGLPKMGVYIRQEGANFEVRPAKHFEFVGRELIYKPDNHFVTFNTSSEDELFFALAKMSQVARG